MYIFHAHLFNIKLTQNSYNVVYNIPIDKY